jgi:hypothetical protein
MPSKKYYPGNDHDEADIFGNNAALSQRSQERLQKFRRYEFKRFAQRNGGEKI